MENYKRTEISKADKLYHGSSHLIDVVLKPILVHGTLEHVHTRPAVFATSRKDLAALFMFPADILASIGFEQDIAYICIWGIPDEFTSKDREGFLYTLPAENFEKVGKEYEWQSFQEVKPVEITTFPYVIKGMMECGVQVYFINDDNVFDRIVTDKNNRSPILQKLTSENQKYSINIKVFS